VARNRRYLNRFFIRMALVTFTMLALGPVLWGVVTSLFPLSSLTSQPPNLNPANITLENYFLVFDTSRGLFSGLINSFIIALFTSAVALAVGSAAAYALARLNMPGSNLILMTILATQMFPGIVIAFHFSW
jgi:multiple sugar transport system permease protein